MKIERRKVYDPDENAIVVVPAIAISLFVFAYSLIYGQKAILVFYACWLPALLVQPALLTRDFGRILPILFVPALAAMSTLWSDAASLTLRTSIQFGTTVLCGLVAARMTSIPNLALGGTVGGLVIMLYSFAYGEYGYDVVDGGFAFAGAFASKNQLGLYASLTILFSAAVLFIFRASLLWRLVAGGACVLAIIALEMADSATSVVTLLLAIIVILTAWGIFHLPPRLRGGSIVALLCIVAVAIGAAVQLGALNAIFEAFGKDTTLTGRTYLWNQGILFGNERPAFGLGYAAFWVHNRPEAEDLWREFYIGGRQGFHFHNTLVEAYVALGLAGVIAIAGMILTLLILSFRVLANRVYVGSAMLCGGLAMMFIIRSYVEIDFFTPYTAGGFLVPFLLLHMSDQRSAERQFRNAPEPGAMAYG